ncbi:MAG: hypothetical protein ACOX2L_05335 [Anaerolineae bacterium]|nr:hypothetical protein [Chloroflexota bacterium]
MLEQLIHHGVIVPDPPEAPGLSIVLRGQQIALTPAQEEMALAWAAKKDTPYVQDPVFVNNFLGDFAAALGVAGELSLQEIDFSAYEALIDRQRAVKAGLSKEERRDAAAERKRLREAQKAEFGYAIVDGQRVELGTYMVEPSGIFMGRGQHPLRGRWKVGARRQDITLNSSPDNHAALGEGWDEIVWQPESLWVARWKDRLTDKLKYIWLSDTAPVKQEREADKFDQALQLDKKLAEVQAAIHRGIQSDNERQRMVATACYLIDALCLRVGDEKDADEADTVGATTLRPEHVTLHADGVAEFDFLGKDSVHWHKKLDLPPHVYRSFSELIANARPSHAGEDDTSPSAGLPQLFPDVTSSQVNAFFSRILPGLSAKKFRTYYATVTVQHKLQRARVRASDPEYKKWQVANEANLAAAELCNHTKQVSGNWETTQGRYEERISKATDRVAAARKKRREANSQLRALQEEAQEAAAQASDDRREQIALRYERRLEVARRRVEQADLRVERASQAVAKLKAQFDIARRKRQWNTSTSLKSYIDPRVYQRWGEKVDYDALGSFYPTALRRKYAWVREIDLEVPGEHLVRPCLPADLEQVVELLQRASGEDWTEEEVGTRFLPVLGQAWRVALVALNQEDDVLALATLGPVFQQGQAQLVDCFAVVDEGARTPDLSEQLAAELTRQFERFCLDHPVRRGQEPYRISPQDERWYRWAPGLPEALGLLKKPDQEECSAGEVADGSPSEAVAQ